MKSISIGGITPINLRSDCRENSRKLYPSSVDIKSGDYVKNRHLKGALF
jgi:hypothetical protein